MTSDKIKTIFSACDTTAVEKLKTELEKVVPSSNNFNAELRLGRSISEGNEQFLVNISIKLKPARPDALPDTIENYLFSLFNSLPDPDKQLVIETFDYLYSVSNIGLKLNVSPALMIDYDCGVFMFSFCQSKTI